MKINFPVFLIAVAIIFTASCSQKSTSIHPGKGITYNNSDIQLNKTSVAELLKLFDIKDSFPTVFVEAECFDELGNPLNCGHYAKNIRYEGMTFDFGGQAEEDLQLTWITLPITSSSNVVINDSIEISQEYNEVPTHFPARTQYDHEGENAMAYDLYSYGISFRYDSTDKKKRLKEVAVHYQISD